MPSLLEFQSSPAAPEDLADWVEIIIPFTYHDPRTADRVDSVTEDDLLNFLEEWRASNENIPVTLGHPSLDKPGVGTVEDLLLATVAGRVGVWAKLDVDWSTFARGTSVSVVYSRNKVNEHTGKRRKFWIEAVGLTGKPIIRGLKVGENVAKEIAKKGSIQLALSICNAQGEHEPTSTPTLEDEMKSIALLLGLPEDASEAAILAAVKTLQDTSTQVQTLTAKMTALEEVVNSVKTLLPNDGKTIADAVKELSERPTQQALSQARQNDRRSLLVSLGWDVEGADKERVDRALDIDLISLELSSGKSFFDLKEWMPPGGSNFQTPPQDNSTNIPTEKSATDEAVAALR